MTDTHTTNDSELIATAYLSFPSRAPAVAAEVPAVSPEHDDTPIDLTLIDVPTEPVNEPAPLTVLVKSRISGGVRTLRDPSHYSVDLPSAGVLYEGDVQDVVASLVKGRHQVKFTRAARYASYRYTAEALGSTLDGDADIMSMTQQDALYLMYWLRTNSYPKRQFTHVTYCDSPAHLSKIATGELDKETLKNLEIVSHTSLNVTRLERDVVAAFVRVAETQYAEEMREINAAGYALGAPLVRDVVVLSEMVDEKPWVDDDDLQELLDFALYLHPLDTTAVPVPLDVRANVAGDLSPAALSLLNAWQILITNYGVRETRNVTCGTCGHTREVNLLLTAADFA